MPSAPAIAASVSRTTASYSPACSAVSDTARSVSVLGGSSGAMPGSDLRRRSRKGRTSAGQPLRGRRVLAALDGLRVAGAEGAEPAEQPRRGPVEDRPQLGEVVLHRGAGERDARRGADGAQLPCAVAEYGFLTCWASSATTMPQATLGEPCRVEPHRAVRGEHELAVRRGRPGCAPAPWKRRTGVPGANRLDLPLPVAQQGRRADDEGGPGGGASVCRCRCRAMSVMVLPRPMSSARQPPRPSEVIRASQPRPRSW